MNETTFSPSRPADILQRWCDGSLAGGPAGHDKGLPARTSARDEVGYRQAYASKTDHLVIGLMSRNFYSTESIATLVRIVTDEPERWPP